MPTFVKSQTFLGPGVLKHWFDGFAKAFIRGEGADL